MLRGIGSILFIGMLIAVPPMAVGQEQKPLRVCLVSGAAEYETHKTMPILQKYLEAKYPVRCTRAFSTSESDLPGLENLDSCDVMVLYTRRLKLQGDQLERIKRYCLAGKPIVGIRTASHAIQTWLDLDNEVLGGNYKNHYKEGPKTQLQIVKGAEKHPVLAGVRAYASAGSLYRNKGLASDVNVLLNGTIPNEEEPIAWTRQYKGARIFYTSLGHQKDFEEENFLRLIGNAVLWASHREAWIGK